MDPAKYQRRAETAASWWRLKQRHLFNRQGTKALRRSGDHRCFPRLHHCCRCLGERGVEDRDGRHGRGSTSTRAGHVCIGEVGGQAPDGFDFRNSPFEISTIDFRDKTIIQRTSAGTQGIVTASRAKRLYAASLVTAEATVRAILAGSADQVCLVAMGDNGVNRTDEDELSATHLRNRLEGRPGDADAIRRLILTGGEVGRFHDPAHGYLHPEDVDIAVDIDRYDFAVRVEFENGRPVARVEKASPRLYAANPSR